MIKHQLLDIRNQELTMDDQTTTILKKMNERIRVLQLYPQVWNCIALMEEEQAALWRVIWD